MAEEERNGRTRDASGRFVSRDRGDAEEERGSEEPQDEQGSERQEDEQATEEQQGGGEQGGGAEHGGAEDISDTPAPSIGPHSTFEREPVEERLARHEQSSVDAMGHDKRRQVVGKTYGPTLARQAALYGVALVIIVAIGFGIKVAVGHFDQPPDHFKAEAPWAQKGVHQIKPKPLQ